MPPSTVKILRSTDDTTIFAEATGDPKNLHLVLLSGLSLSGCVFDDMCADERLLETLYIVRYDIRGHGRSGKPSTPEAYKSKLFADDFKTVQDAFGLRRPVLAGWSMGAAVATDVVRHLPSATLSGVIYLAGVPATSLLSELASPPLIAILPALVLNESVSAYQAAADAFTDKLFAQPDAVPYDVRCLHKGHSLTPVIMGLSLARPMAVEDLWRAGQEGLPLLMLQGTLDRHRIGSAKGIHQIMRPHFRNIEMVWLEGRGHALHYECREEVIEHLIRFTTKCGGKDYRAMMAI
ncbi:alpha/beta-hydrolase [Mycena rosella]|uniref:Alpha/beta-hydrolase n=1 Tax=Mycena rosella TaxID=1033263 RepID=A0AAD7GMB2_MYCRO|nr:alpha/beta-hydrolase [Mycena rosella]